MCIRPDIAPPHERTTASAAAGKGRRGRGAGGTGPTVCQGMRGKENTGQVSDCQRQFNERKRENRKKQKKEQKYMKCKETKDQNWPNSRQQS